jgi:DNA-binding MarR family transcriptional regulator
MEKDGLIKKVKDLDRRNLVRVALTEKGKEALRQSSKRESIHRIMSGLSQEERRQVKTSLQKLWNKAMEELGGESEAPFDFSE